MMKENSAQRRSIRLRGYDYSQLGSYFFTICVQNRECLFGQVHDGRMILNTLGNIVSEIWYELPQRFPNIELDAFVIMPNHIHNIIHTPQNVPSTKLGNIVGAFKSISAIRINQLLGRQGLSLWQRNYYERIIRNEDEYLRIREYIVNNPLKWDEDSENPLKGNWTGQAHAPTIREISKI